MGLGMARYLVAAGAKVLVRGWREAELQRVVAELGENATYQVYDVADNQGADGLLQAAVNWFGTFTTLNDNGGQSIGKNTDQLPDGELYSVVRTQVSGAFPAQPGSEPHACTPPTAGLSC